MDSVEVRAIAARYERSTSAESGSGFVITRPILRPRHSVGSEHRSSPVGCARSIHVDLVPPQLSSPGRLKKAEGLTRRFPGVRFRGRTSPDTVLFFRLTKLCLIPPS